MGAVTTTWYSWHLSVLFLLPYHAEKSWIIFPSLHIQDDNLLHHPQEYTRSFGHQLLDITPPPEINHVVLNLLYAGRTILDYLYCKDSKQRTEAGGGKHYPIFFHMMR